MYIMLFQQGRKRVNYCTKKSHKVQFPGKRGGSHGSLKYQVFPQTEYPFYSNLIAQLNTTIIPSNIERKIGQERTQEF